MEHGAGSRYGRAALVAIGLACLSARCSAAEDGAAQLLWPPVTEERSKDIFLSERSQRGSLAATTLMGPRTTVARQHRLQVDISPFVDEVLGFFRRHGIPLKEQRDERGRGPVGVSAAVSVGKDIPAVSFHLGDRPPEPMGAFYSNERGLRWAVFWPVEHFSLRIEGGEDSEFGYYAIAGVQWADPARGLAAGLGVPMNLRDAEGDVGVVFQLRMNLR